ncbi:MAG TPA: tyrosine-type recombinase/integrase [Ktedonobacteraceae bacterium]
MGNIAKCVKGDAAVIRIDICKLALQAVTPEPDVFVSRGNGRGSAKHVCPRQVQFIVRTAAIQAGIDKPASSHFLRHTHASIALERGYPIDLVRDTLSHDNVSTTNKYLHAHPEHSSAEYV